MSCRKMAATDSESKLGEEEEKMGNVSSWLKSMCSDSEKSIVSSCRICLSSILDPARLACGHRFCERCLDMYWKSTEEPEFVVCPLCRDCAFKVGFVEKLNVNSTRDFRRRFDPNHVEPPIDESSSSKSDTSTLCLKISIIMPIVFFMIQYIKPIIMNIIMMF